MTDSSMTALPMTALDKIHAFLPCHTPERWVQNALENPALMLIDHANCEKKAASTALSLINRYTENFELLNKMSRLVREEMRHFEQVIALMKRRNIKYSYLSASRYATGMRDQARKSDPGKLVDVLIIGAFIEARSCERFSKLAPHLDSELERFYRSLLRSEARHFKDYLVLAKGVAGDQSIDDRIAEIAAIEQQLIEQPDTEFRFHSGPLYL
jgi:tRNA-(ms[2]io[6]A)-hydroxylase